jgi:hypothetical protein
MDLLSRRARTGITAAATGGILVLCLGAMALGQNRIWTGTLSTKHKGIGCSDCHAGGRAPDRQCAGCHTEADPTLVARDAHRGLLKAPDAFGRQGSRAGWGGHPHLALACASCHREHEEDGASVRQVANAVCEACHARQHETSTSRHQRKRFYARQDAAARRKFDALQGAVLDTWSRRCVTCHHEHGSRPPEKNARPGEAYDVDEGEIKE